MISLILEAKSLCPFIFQSFQEIKDFPFHVIKHLTTGFDNLRISLMKQCIYESNGYYLLKKWSWLLKTDNVELDNERKYNRRFNRTMSRRDILNTIFDSFPILKQAYDLKEEYRYINKNCSYEEALSRFKDIRKNSKMLKSLSMTNLHPYYSTGRKKY